MPQPRLREIRFEVRPFDDEPSPSHELVPYVDDVSLISLVDAYERSAGFDVPGDYAGLVLEHFDFGDVSRYLLGASEVDYWSWHGSIALLGCTCGEVGCWPLESRVRADDELVTWDRFAQPHRPTRDYTAFGPYVFARQPYDEAVRAALAQTDSPPPR